MFEYLTELVDKDDLQAFLTRHGQDGWRLHTCDETQKGTWAGQILVVMDRIAKQEDAQKAEESGEPEAMACKG